MEKWQFGQTFDWNESNLSENFCMVVKEHQKQIHFILVLKLTMRLV